MDIEEAIEEIRKALKLPDVPKLYFHPVEHALECVPAVERLQRQAAVALTHHLLVLRLDLGRGAFMMKGLCNCSSELLLGAARVTTAEDRAAFVGHAIEAFALHRRQQAGDA